jgi:hypothetical protein
LYYLDEGAGGDGDLQGFSFPALKYSIHHGLSFLNYIMTALSLFSLSLSFSHYYYYSSVIIISLRDGLLGGYYEVFVVATCIYISLLLAAAAAGWFSDGLILGQERQSEGRCLEGAVWPQVGPDGVLGRVPVLHHGANGNAARTLQEGAVVARERVEVIDADEGLIVS